MYQAKQDGQRVWWSANSTNTNTNNPAVTRECPQQESSDEREEEEQVEEAGEEPLT